MIDFGIDKLALIGAVALVVIGPERLPRVARTLGILAGRLQRYVADVKADINREVELDELRKMKDSVQQAASGIEASVPPTAVLGRRTMPGAEWFPGARLNYAQHVLRRERPGETGHVDRQNAQNRDAPDQI